MTKDNSKNNVWVILALLVLLLIWFFSNEDKNTQIEDMRLQMEDAADCVSECEFNADYCSSMAESQSNSYADISRSNADLQDCLDEFRFCVEDCNAILDK